MWRVMELHPIERLQRCIDVPMPFKKWRRFPRLWGYKNEYWDGAARFTPNPSSVDVFLDVADWRSPTPRFPSLMGERFSVRTLTEPDWEEMYALFQHSFSEQIPLAG